MLWRRSMVRCSGMTSTIRYPRIAATIASAMPVLPLVASISVSPGLISPRRSAPRIIESAGRSLTDPAGLLPSSFASSALELRPGMRCSRTRGVLPTNFSRVESMGSNGKPRARRGFRVAGTESLLLLLFFLLGLGLRVGLGFLLVGLCLLLLGFLLGRGLLLLGLLLGGGLLLVGLRLVRIRLGFRLVGLFLGLGRGFLGFLRRLGRALVGL